MDASPIIRVESLSTEFRTRRGVAKALEDLSFEIRPGETLALVGESGSGKSVTSLSLMGLLPPSGRISSGRILFRDGDVVIDLAQAPQARMRGIRGRGISMIFQEPMSALNPSLTVGRQIAEAVISHDRLSNAQALASAETLLAKVGVTDPARRLGAYPHQLSGGMRQRVLIAMAAACRPALMIADEPTTALDVATQAQVLLLLRNLQIEGEMGLLFITHNLALATVIADRIMVMYAGRMVESGPVSAVLESPRHPYTQALLDCLPARHLPRRPTSVDRLPTIVGASPTLVDRPTGCDFRTRCPRAMDACLHPGPELRHDKASSRSVRCLLNVQDR